MLLNALFVALLIVLLAMVTLSLKITQLQRLAHKTGETFKIDLGPPGFGLIITVRPPKDT